MVATEIPHRHAFRHRSYRREGANAAPGHHILVVHPEIEDITQEEKPFRIGGQAVQEVQRTGGANRNHRFGEGALRQCGNDINLVNHAVCADIAADDLRHIVQVDLSAACLAV